MTTPIITPETKKESNAVVDMLLIGAGLMMIMMACGLLTLFLWQNGRNHTSLTLENEAAGETAVYNGSPILEVPAGSTQIEALAYSDQVPVVVMFDADW